MRQESFARLSRWRASQDSQGARQRSELSPAAERTTLICEKMEVVSHLRFAGEGGGLRNRCRFEGQTWIRQVLISRTLSVCGEVAERLKAAVC